MDNRYQCSNQPFYKEWIVDSNGKFSIMFACDDLINATVHQGANELRCPNADGTFKVVPSTPYCRQLFIIHLLLQNHVRKINISIQKILYGQIINMFNFSQSQYAMSLWKLRLRLRIQKY